ncbi:MAG: ABC transporter permease [bacterium]
MSTKIYIPDGLIKKGWLALWKDMFRELLEAKELIMRLFIRDFLGSYKQSVLGMFWIVIKPLTLIGMFIFMNRSGILNIGETPIPYPAYAILGLTIWQLFASGIIGCTNSIINAGNMVAKINFPKEALVISSFAHAFFDFLISLVFVMIVFALYKVIPSWKIILFPFLLIPLILFTFALGFIFSLFNTIVRDTVNIVNLGTTFFLFITPVLYPTPKTRLFAYLSRYNLLDALVNEPRNLIINGQLKEAYRYFGATCLVVVIFLLSWRVFHLSEPRLAERI